MGILLICFAIVIRPLLDPDTQYVRHERTPQPSPAAASDRVDAQPLPTETPEPTPEAIAAAPANLAPEPTAIAAAATPTPVATPEPTVIPTSVSVAADADAGPSAPGAPRPSVQPSAEPSPPPATTQTPAATKFTALAPPVDLLSPFRSYMRVDAVMSDLQQRGYLPALESNHQPLRDDVPPHDVDIITVREYKHWDQSGRLEMTFFNDRLYQTEFEPEDAAAYRAQQRKHLPEVPRERSGRSELTRGHLRIASSLDLAVSEVGEKLRSRAFLLWQDLRLVQQREEWDQHYALEAFTR